MEYLKPLLAYWEFISKVPKNKKSRKAWEGLMLYDICVINVFTLIIVLKIFWG